MSNTSNRDREERAFDALIVSQLRRERDIMNLEDLPELAPDERESCSNLPHDLVATLWDEETRDSIADPSHVQPALTTSTENDTSQQPAKRPSVAPRFKVGDLVALKSNPAIVMPIIEVLSDAVECRYRVFHNGVKATYYDRQLDKCQSDDRQRLTAEELQAHITGLQLLSPSTANLFSIRSGRVQFVPYQYRPVLKLIRADRPRLLIADEVGVGKTIEAGLIIKELRARMDLSSVLIICPKALVSERKWFLEMKRFDESFTALDGDLLRHCLRETDLEGDWPDQYSKAILPFSLFDSDLLFGNGSKAKLTNKGLLKLDPPPRFDLVIVDEAHHIRNSDTFLHQGVRYFCDNAEAVLFLTATPVQLGSEDLYTLLNAMRPDLIIDAASFAQMAEPNPFINAAVQHCRTGVNGWRKDAMESLTQAAHTTWGKLFLESSPAYQGIVQRLQQQSVTAPERVSLIRAVEELYTFSPLINRTRRRDIGIFTTRKPETQSIPFTPPQQSLHDAILSVIARILTHCHGQQNVKFMMTTIRRQTASCLYGLAPLLQDILAGKVNQLEFMESSDCEEDASLDFIFQIRGDIDDLLEKARHLPLSDPKVEAFVRIVEDKHRLSNNKVLVFSTFRHTLRYLASHLDRAAIRFGLIHGDVPDEERATLRKRFSLPKESPESLDVLLSSEVGCEGLDFQFCDFLVNYDLPWNPMRIEQRIGRIDRYGQKSDTIAIVNFITPGTVDADIYNRCLLRIGVFQHSVGGNEEILGEIAKGIHDIAESFILNPSETEQRLRQLADNSIRQIQEEQELESKQAELLGLNVPNQTWKEEIEAAESYWLSPAALQRFVTSYLAGRAGTDTQHLLGEKPMKTLRLNQDSRGRLLKDFKEMPRSNDPVDRSWEKWLKGGSPTLAITFDQETATQNPEVMHVSVTHPLIRQAARHVQIGDPLYATLAVTSDEAPHGSHCFAVYRWSKKGVRDDEALVPVAADPDIEKKLMDLLPQAHEFDEVQLPDRSEFELLDARHHIKWSAAQAKHIATNRQLIDHRIQSLSVSHKARCQLIEDQLLRATNEKIRLMKQSELLRAKADFARRIAELEQAATSGDVHSIAVLFGVLVVKG